MCLALISGPRLLFLFHAAPAAATSSATGGVGHPASATSWRRARQCLLPAPRLCMSGCTALPSPLSTPESTRSAVGPLQAPRARWGLACPFVSHRPGSRRWASHRPQPPRNSATPLPPDAVRRPLILTYTHCTRLIPWLTQTAAALVAPMLGQRLPCPPCSHPVGCPQGGQQRCAWHRPPVRALPSSAAFPLPPKK